MDTTTIKPDTVGSLGTGLQIAGILGQTTGAYRKSSLEKTGYEYQSKVASNNAGIAEQQESDALLRGANTENIVRQNTAQLKGKQRADFAARGIDMGSGSALDILTSTDYMGERDALKARDNANREAWGLGVQAQNARDQAALLNWRAGQQSPGRDALATLLTGAGKVATSWYSLRNARTGTPTDTSLGANQIAGDIGGDYA